MLSSLLSSQPKKRNEVLSIDLGQQSTKVVQLGRKGEKFELRSFGIHPSPFQDKPMTAENLAEHLKAVLQAMDLKLKKVSIVLGLNDSLLRQAEMPMVPLSDMRLMLKYSSKNYLQQELADHVFDCHILPVAAGANGGADAPKQQLQKVKVLAGGAKQQTVDMLLSAAKMAGLILEDVVPAMICPPNAFEHSHEDDFKKETIALVDIGFKSSSINIILNGELALSRFVGYGGDKLTSGIAEVQNISYADAETMKLSLPEDIQTIVQALLMPLGRELRASIDFFEHQQDKTVSQIYVSGGSARSKFIVDMLQGELMVPAKTWSPIGNMNLAVPVRQMADVEQAAPQLAVSIGGALSAL